MNKILCLFLASGVFFQSFCQDQLFNFKNDLKTSAYSTKEVIPVVNQDTDDIAFFLMDSKRVYGYLFDENFKLLDKLSSEDKRRKYKSIVGYGINNRKSFNICLSDKRHRKFAILNFSFESGNSSIKEFELKGIGEKFVQTATVKNRFYLFSIVNGTSKLKIYEINDEGIPEILTLDFNKEKFKGKQSLVHLYDMFTVTSKGTFVDATVKKIEGNIPTSIEVASEERKLYIIDDKIVFTFDNNNKVTQILTIDPSDFSYTKEDIVKPQEAIDGTKKRVTNSFINDLKYFSISSSRDNMVFRIQDYNSRRIEKEIHLKKEDSITFKNTPIIQEGGVYDNYREMESSKKFLRKITSGDVGVAVYKQKDEYVITLGGKKEIVIGGGDMMMPMGGFGGIPITTAGSVNIFFNPTYFAYNSYTSTKSTHIKCLFDSSFNHLKGEIQDNAFDKLRGFEQAGTVQSAKTVFKYKDFFVLGNYFGAQKSYVLRKFQD